MSLQSKLLRFLQERKIERLGGRKEIPVDVRILCATHQNIEQQIKEGNFREDLYYRVSEMVVTIPPLRNREGDAIVIATALLQRFCKQQNKKIMSFTQEAAKAIELYRWPGNIRELENRIKRAVIMTDTLNIGVDDLQLEQCTDDEQTTATPLNLKEVRELAETNAINRALGYTQNNVTNAAKLLGVTRPTLYTLFTKYAIQVPQD